MARILLEIPKEVYGKIWAHLLPRRFVSEEAAFMFVRRENEDKVRFFRYLEWDPVPPKGFLSRSGFHFELTDETRAMSIKHAHDLDASLVELHSHKGRWPAEFSASDLLGFQEFVPHVWWRLKGRSYLAVVVSRSGFDGLAWITNPDTPERLDAILVEKSVLTPTKLSPLRYDSYEQ